MSRESELRERVEALLERWKVRVKATDHYGDTPWRRELAERTEDLIAVLTTPDSPREEEPGLREALERIMGMCGDVNRCICGRPTGIPAVVACAKKALSRPSAAEALTRLQELSQEAVDRWVCDPAETSSELDSAMENLDVFLAKQAALRESAKEGKTT